MSRPFVLALFALVAASPVRAADPVPETLLPVSSQLYLRWDGVTAHADAYKKSVWGGVMAGPTGDSIRALIAKAPKLLGNSLLADPLLDGKPPEELKANLADVKNAARLVDVIAETGVVVAAELREPRPTLRGVGKAIGGLLGGELPGAEAVAPDVMVYVVVPDAGPRSAVLFSVLRLALGKSDGKVEPLAVAGRKGFRLVPDDNTPPGRGDPFQFQAGWWTEGKHFVLYIGTRSPADAVAEVAAAVEKGGLTKHPLFVRVTKNPGYESVARGFVDAARLVSLAKSLAGPLVPGIGHRLDDLGVGNLKAVAFNSGFDGKESRATWEFDLPGERKGFAKVLKKEPLGLADLPPLPPDVSRFSALRVDPDATYDAILSLVETATAKESFGVEDDAKTPAEKIRARREYLAKEADKYAGLDIKADLLPHLGDKIVMYQSPTEGLSVFGSVVCVSLKDPAKAKAAADRVQRGIEALAGTSIKVKKKMLKGVEVRELYSRGFGFLTPTYAIAGDWLVIALNPQPVQGFVLRLKGELPAWKPDAATAARLAKMQPGCGLQYCDPRSTVQNLCCVGPLLLGFVAAQGAFNRDNGESDFDPIEIGLIPNGHELSKHLFPNLTVTRDDGTTVRIEVNESFSLPLEFIGLEPIVLLGGFSGVFFAFGF